jgi:glycosyltransferase involved in cell wall biosynthesis
MSKKIFIYAGYAPSPYNGLNYQTASGCRGSEIALVNLSEQLAKRNEVVVSYHPIIEGVVNGVQYLAFEKIQDFLNNNHIDVLIVSRYIHFFEKFVSEAKKTFFMLHDHQIIPWIWGKSLPNEGIDLLRSSWATLDGVFFLSEWHRENFKLIYGISNNNKLNIIPNGIAPSKFQSFSRENKIKNRFCYNSANGGMKDAINFFSQYKIFNPESELHIFTKDSGVDSDGIFYRGIVPNDQMIEEMMISSFWLYPATIPETYCISALEARCAGCVPIVNCMGGMKDSLNGYFLDINDKNILEKINKLNFNVFWEDSRKNALNNSWDSVSRKWESYF